MPARRRPTVWGLGSLCVVAVVTVVAVLELSGGGEPNAAASPSATSWTVYHGDAAGSGVAAAITSVSTAIAKWRSPALDGKLFGQPVAFGTSVFVATQNDTVYSLNALSGAVTWSSHVGTPVAASALPCGNISPTVGITGTPVLDAARGELFVVADELRNAAPAHHLIGLATATGKIELDQTIDPLGSDPAALLQRTGLALDNGRVVFGFGGNYGDCGSYRGWVVSVPEAGGNPASFAVDSGAGEHEGAVWMGGGAPAIDAAGNIWVSAGNGSVTSSTHAYDNSDSVLELSPTLSLLQFFAPTSWASDNGADKDFSTTPALLPDGQVVIAGKSRIVYLLNGAHLGGIGGQQAALPSGCGDDIDGGMAVVGSTVYLPCLTGTEAVQTTTSPAALHLLWNSGVGGGPPIVAAGEVWTMGQDGVLYGLNATTGKVQQMANVGQPANHFPTPAIGAGSLLAAGANEVVAFPVSTASATAPTTTSTATTSTAHPSTTPSTSAAPRHEKATNGFPAGGVAGIVIGSVALVAGVSLAIRRRARRGD